MIFSAATFFLFISAFQRESSEVMPGKIEDHHDRCWDHVAHSLKGIEFSAFSISSLQSIVIPQSVETLDSKCFVDCELLSSVSFESNSQLKRINSSAFAGTKIQSVSVPV
jgi:hypothetical protein